MSATVTLVAAVGRNDVIGVDGGLPWRLPGDLPRVKAMTMGHVVIMGRKTFDSVGAVLPGRTTIVVTRQPGWSPPETAQVPQPGDSRQPDDSSRPGVASRSGEPLPTAVHVASSVPQALELAASIDDDVFVLGGAQIYAQTMHAADRLELTEVHASPAGDAYFPEVDWPAWREVARDPRDGFDFVTYTRARP